MKENEIALTLTKLIDNISKETGAFKITCPKSVSGQGVEGEKKKSLYPDLTLEVRTKTNRKYTFYFDIKSTGQPRYVRMAAGKLHEMISNKPKHYGIVVSTYLSEESVRICRDNKIGFIDLAGNCLINIDDIYIDIRGKPNPSPNKRRIKSIFSQKTTRALRVLLCHPGRDWYVKELAEEANISLGLTSNFKQKLLDFEFIREKGRAFSLVAPEALLNKWSENYSYHENKTTGFYSLDGVVDIEKSLAEYCTSQHIRYAFTLTTGASQVAPSLRYDKVFAYLQVPSEQIIRELGWKAVDSGPNISILEPYDKGVFYGLRQINEYTVVSDIQLYLDLNSYKGRGEEAAKFLLENRIRKKW
ncbi:MAG: hypothetical protein GY757_49625 [bacterium]|nr:hypothetical protein [bacterium]